MRRRAALWGVCLVASMAAQAANYYVSPTTEDAIVDDLSGYDGTFATIAAAVAAAQAGDTVCLGTGTFREAAEVVIDKAITIGGVARPEDTVYDGENKRRGFEITVADAVVKNMTFTRFGKSYNDGMCVTMSGASLVTNCIARQNGGYPEYKGQYFRLSFDLSAGTLSGCIITNNYGPLNPGIRIRGPKVLVENCYIADNRHYGDSNYDGTAILLDSGASGATVRNCTIVNNQGDKSAAIAVKVANGYSGVNFYNNIIYNNSSFDGSVARNWDTAKASHTANWQNNCTFPVEGLLGANNIDGNPLFLEDGMHLSSGSPCLGAGDPVYAPAVDLAGATRPNLPAMGCLEYVSMGLSVLIHFSETQVYDPATVTCEAVVEGATGTLSYAWDFDGDGTVDSTDAAPVLSGICHYGNVSVAVSDGNGTPVTATATTAVTIYNRDGILHVTNEPNPNKKPPYGTWETAAETIAEAVPLCPVGGTILLSDGLHAPPKSSSTIHVSKPLVITSEHGRDRTSLTVNQTPRYLILDHADAVLEGVTVTNSVFANWDGPGNGFCIKKGTIRDCRFTDCSTQGPGIVGTEGSSADERRIRRCMFDRNRKNSAWGSTGGNAALWIVGDHSLVEDCLIAHNVDPTVDSNRHGGAFECSGTDVVFRNNTIVGNETRRGPCLYFSKAPKIFENNIVYGNVVNLAETQDDRTQLVASNDPTVGETTVVPATVAWNNCIYPTTTDYASYAGFLTEDPLFKDAAAGNYILRGGSPCIGAGTNENVTSAIDLLGNRRITGRRVDLGCFEYPREPGLHIIMR